MVGIFGFVVVVFLKIVESDLIEFVDIFGFVEYTCFFIV